MLIIQIALGIVLAVVALRFWTNIIAFGVVGMIALAVLFAVILGASYIYEVLSLVLIIFITFAVYCSIGIAGAELSVVTIKKWNLDSGDVAGMVFGVALLICGIYFAFNNYVTDKHSDAFVSICVFLLFASCSAAVFYVQLKEIKKTRGLRSIKKTYTE